MPLPSLPQARGSLATLASVGITRSMDMNEIGTVPALKHEDKWERRRQLRFSRASAMQGSSLPQL
jgi:hypothetical protein